MFYFRWLGGQRGRAKAPLKEPRYYPDSDAIYRRIRLMERQIESIDLRMQGAVREAHAARQAVTYAQRSPSGESQPVKKRLVSVPVVVGTDLDAVLARSRDGAK